MIVAIPSSARASIMDFGIYSSIHLPLLSFMREGGVKSLSELNYINVFIITILARNKRLYSKDQIGNGIP